MSYLVPVEEKPADGGRRRASGGGDHFALTGRPMSTLRRKMEKYFKDNNYVTLTGSSHVDENRDVDDDDEPALGRFTYNSNKNKRDTSNFNSLSQWLDDCDNERQAKLDRKLSKGEHGGKPFQDRKLSKISTTTTEKSHDVKKLESGQPYYASSEFDEFCDDDDVDDDDNFPSGDRAPTAFVYLPSDLMEKAAQIRRTKNTGQQKSAAAVAKSSSESPAGPPESSCCSSSGHHQQQCPKVVEELLEEQPAPQPKKGAFYVEGDLFGSSRESSASRSDRSSHNGAAAPQGRQPYAGPCCSTTLEDEDEDILVERLGFLGCSTSTNRAESQPLAVAPDVKRPHEQYFSYHQSAGDGAAATTAVGPKLSLMSDILRNDIQHIDDDDVIEAGHCRKPPKIINGHLFVEEIGSGAYARVKECLHLASLQRRAVKIIKMERIRKIRDALDDIDREVRLLKRLKHKNIIEMFDYFWLEPKGKLYLFMELCASSIQQLLENYCGRERRLNVQSSRFYFVQLLDALEYLHSQNVAHKDVKAGNLLITVDHVIKLVDFGVSDELDPFDPQHLCSNSRGTPKFQPPEIAGGARFFDGFKVDVWSAGVTLFNMSSGQYPYEGSTIFIIYDRIINQVFVTPDCITDPDLRDLLGQMLIKNPDERWSVARIQRHPWVASHRGQAVPIEDLPDLTGLAVEQNFSTVVYDYLKNLDNYEYGESTSGRSKSCQSNGKDCRHLCPESKNSDIPELYVSSCGDQRRRPSLFKNVQTEPVLGAASCSTPGVKDPRTTLSSINIGGGDRSRDDDDDPAMASNNDNRRSNRLRRSLSTFRSVRFRLKTSNKWPKVECKTQ